MLCRVDEEARRDAAPAIRLGCPDRLVAATATGHDDPAACRNGTARRVARDVPGTASGQEMSAVVGEPRDAERAVLALVVTLPAVRDVELDDLLPQPLVAPWV